MTKPRFFLITMLIVLPPVAQAIDCSDAGTYEGNLVLDQQSDLAIYKIKPLRIVRGDLAISGSDIVNVEALSCMSVIEGQLRVEDNPNLTSLLPLGGLEFLGGGVFISNNDVLRDLPQWRKLEETPFVVINNNDRLEEVVFATLERMLSTDASVLTIAFNESLEFVEFRKLRTTDRMLVTGNPLLKELKFEQVSGVEEQFQIFSSPKLSLLSFPALERIGNLFEVISNENLIRIEMPRLRAFDNTLSIGIQNNPRLEVVTTDELADILRLDLIFSRSLHSFPFGQIRTVAEILAVSDTAELDKIEFTRLVSVGSGIGITRNLKLRRLTLKEIDSIGGILAIEHNPQLRSCDVIEHLARRGFYLENNSFIIADNDDRGMVEGIGANSQAQLELIRGAICVSGGIGLTSGTYTSFEPLQSIKYVAGSILIEAGYLPTRIDFPQLVAVGQRVRILYTNGVEEISFPRLFRTDDFSIFHSNSVIKITAPELNTISGSLQVEGFDVLQSLNLDSLRTVTGNFRIVENANLDAGIVLAILAQTNVGGESEICGNQSSPAC